ncbi:MAG: NHLP family bacteriocin export ABC transporter peptidase/permease/ATPase subunit [Acidobacteria bacterium]|nr:NHLP family bacteriocin export ABC transporter peptidase/permease/ATPase subunit [Acidobacteriota bacterium]
MATVHRRRRVRTPTILQMEAVECGAAALAIVLAYHGRWVPLSELRRECGVSRDGSQASSVLKAARRYGLIARAFRVEMEDLGAMARPYVVFWNFNHFLVVEQIARDRVYLNDPATGPRTVTPDEFRRAYTGLVLTFEPAPVFAPGGHRYRVLPALAARLRESRSAVGLAIGMGLLLVVPGIAIPVFSQVFVDEILIQQNHDWLRPLLLGMVATALLRAYFQYVQLRQLCALRTKLAVVLASGFLWHVLRLPLAFYSQRFAGDISGRVQTNDRVADVIAGQLATTVIDVLMVGFYAAVMLLYDVPLALIGIAATVVNLAIFQLISRRRTDASIRLSLELGKVQAVSITGLQSMETIKASGLESDFFARWAGTFAKTVRAQQELEVTTQKLSVLPSLIASLTGLLVLSVGGLRVMNGAFSIGMLVAFQSLMQSFLQPVSNLVGLGGTIQELQGDLTRIDDVVREPADPQVDAASGSPPPATTRLTGDIELVDVTFGYNRLGPPLLDRFSLRVASGQRVAVVGASGSGKSTVARLLTGLYEPWSGEIRFDGQPRAAHSRARLTASVAMVEQDVFLFEGSVRDNLTLWDRTVSDDAVVQACRDACILDAVMSLPGGLDAELAEGGRNLSGGQRQRLEIARALVQNPSVLVMDEATSALDAETEQIVDRNLRRRGCSCVLVAHRLSTIRDCDEIIVLQHGKVVERGTHDTLIGAGGTYTALIMAAGGALASQGPQAGEGPSAGTADRGRHE